MKHSHALFRYGNLIIILLLTAYIFLLPGITIVRHLRDPAIRANEMPAIAWHIFRQITPRYARWANRRIESGKATELNTYNISGTEWPLFGSVFYLWAIESLQDAWDQDHALFPVAPAEYAREAIDATTALITDPHHATWVKDHWGDDYLHDENVFYRVLLIASLTSQYKLTGACSKLDMLKDQVETLSRDLDQSPHGVLDDYPDECYPMDVLTGVAAIRRADAVLGTDHSAFVQRAIRGFQGNLLDKRGLPPYSGDADIGVAYEPSRGCGISYGLLTAPELWPEVARQWYAGYEKYFWQERYGLAGFREFPNDLEEKELYWDVDSGHVIGSVCVAASAFGVAAARINGRFDHAYPLTAETLVFSWPVANGTLLIPRLLSNAADAPLLGEACILYNLTQRTHPDFEIVTGGRIPAIVFMALSLYFILSIIYATGAIRAFCKWKTHMSNRRIPNERIQLILWATLAIAALPLILLDKVGWAVLVLLVAQLLPRTRLRVRHEEMMKSS